MRRILSLLVLLGCASIANAQLGTGFEPTDYSGDSDGEKLTGQQSWTLPAGTDANVYTYEGNSLGFVDNPHPGGKQFVGTRATDSATFGRAQHAVDFSAGGEWIARYDFAAIWLGGSDETGVNNLGSFSLQDSVANRSFIALNVWADTTKHDAWNAQYNVFDSAGGSLLNQSPGSAWNNLKLNHWYQQETKWDFSQNRITQVTITDLTDGTKTSAFPEGWYLLGGKNPTQPMPTAVRMFGGGDQKQAMGWDNLLVPEPTSLSLIAIAGLMLARRRR